jgi:uncharacterized protein
MRTDLTRPDRPTDTGGLGILAVQECERLLAEGYVGRLAVIIDGRPRIYPMNYRYEPGMLILRTAPGSKLAGLANGTPVAFEIDGLDGEYRSGWSVVVQGTAEIVPPSAVADHIRWRPLRPWARGDRDIWVRVAPATVTGRIIT